jgi:hypothetical protein
MKRVLALVALVALVGCGVKLPPITVVIPPKPPVNSTPPVVTPPAPPVEPVPPVVEPAPDKPFQNLNIWVLKSDQTPIVGALVKTPTEQRTSDGGGFVNFGIQDPTKVEISAPNYAPQAHDLAPGDHKVYLLSTLPPPSPPPTVSACGPLSDGLTCVKEVAKKYGHLLVTNTFASCVEFTQRVLEALGPDWGHVGKTAGESQAVPRGFQPIVVQGFQITGVSHDAIKSRLNGQVVDIIGNATANEPCPPSVRDCWEPGPASVHWDDVPAQFWRPNNPFVPAFPVQP